MPSVSFMINQANSPFARFGAKNISDLQEAKLNTYRARRYGA